MLNRWKALIAVVALVLGGLLLWRFLPGGEPPLEGLTNATIDRLERQVDSLRAVVDQRDAAIAAYEVRVADLDARLGEISQRNGVLIANLNRQRRTIEHDVSNDSLARDLNRILRTDLASRVGAAAAGIPR